MKSWVLLPLLLAALLSARLRLGNAEGDPLPQSLIDLVWDSPISSVEELMLLLQEESSTIEDKEDEHDSPLSPVHGRYIRSLDVQKAQKADCKVRTEVMEITRSMVDRSNGNFLVFPLCVEVQRCSGCCNSRYMHCAPVVNATRNLEVKKFVFKNEKRFIETAIIQVVDHVSCLLQAIPPSTSSSSSSTVFDSQPNPLPAPPQRYPTSSLRLFPSHSSHPLPPKTPTSKADLHRHDDLKHNQHHQLPHKQDPLARQWQQGSYTQLVRWTQPRAHQAPTYAETRLTTAGFLGSVGTWPSEARAEHSVLESPQQVGHESGFDRSREETSGEARRPDHEQRQQELLKHQQRQEHHHHHHHHQQQQHPHLSQQYNPRGDEDQEMRTQYLLHAPQSDSASPPVSMTPAPTTGQNPTSFTTLIQKDSVTSQTYGEVTRHKQVESKGDGPKDGTEREESGSAVSGDSGRVEAANQEKENDSKLSGGADHLTEKERRKKILEMVQSEPEKDPHLHPHQRPKPTTFKSALSTVVPASTAARQVPFRPASPRRRKRKHRKRISKAAMRAMIM